MCTRAGKAHSRLRVRFNRLRTRHLEAINHRHACAARVMDFSVCVCVCVSMLISGTTGYERLQNYASLFSAEGFAQALLLLLSFTDHEEWQLVGDLVCNLCHGQHFGILQQVLHQTS